MTETSPVSTQSSWDDPLDRRVSTVGRVHPHVEIKIVDPETGAIVRRGMPGELCTRGYSVMLGYWGNEDATREAIDAAGWMHTGDLATADADGYVNIVGRIKDMIIRGGENVYPREVEEYLVHAPGCPGCPGHRRPEREVRRRGDGVGQATAGATASSEDLAAFCRGRIATFKIPRYWKFVDEFPTTVTGKIQKFKMREMAVAELGLKAVAGQRTA